MPKSGSGSGDPDDGGLRLSTGIPSGPPNLLDPTPRTMQQVLRENFWLRELIETRLGAMDKALALLQAFADRTPTTMDVQHQVAQLREVVMTKFGGIESTFTQKERELTAAFQAQEKQAIATNNTNAISTQKMEDSFTKQIDGISVGRVQDRKTLEDKIDDVKSRLTVIESRTSISDPSTVVSLAKLDSKVQQLTSSGDIGAGRAAGQTALWALIVGGLGLMISMGATVGYLIKALR